MTTSEIRWTEEQVAAIAARHDQAVIVAGAGSGKTGVLAECVALSIVEDKIDASSILAISFTRKAAAQMRDRIRARTRELKNKELPDEGHAPVLDLGLQVAEADSEPLVATIDSFCQGIVRRNALALGVDPRFGIVADEDPELLARAWSDALSRFISAHGPDAMSFAAKYDDNSRSPLQREVQLVYSRLRTGGDPHPRLEVPNEEQMTAEVEGLLATTKKLAESFLGESESWESKGQTLAESLDKARVVADATFERLDDLPRKVTNRSVTVMRESEFGAQLDESLLRLFEAADNLAARGDLALLAALLEIWDDSYSRIKAEAGLLDFSDLALLTIDLLISAREKGASDSNADWRPSGAQFSRVFLDEAQDINRVQAQLIELISPEGKFYSVGDVAQSIYRFRHAEVEIFEQRSSELGVESKRFELTTNFRSKSSILDVNNQVFASKGLAGLLELTADEANRSSDQLVELLLTDVQRVKERLELPDDPPKWLESLVDNGWRDAEAAAVAIRIKQLVDSGENRPAEITILGRAVSSLLPFAEALRSVGIAATIEGAGGLWIRPEVSDLVALLAATGNSCDEERLYQLLYSPICGLSLDALVVIASDARARKIPVLEALESVELDQPDQELRDRFTTWFARQRELAGRRSLADAIEAALIETGYDLYLLGLPAGDRRLANVRRMQSLAATWESEHGADPAGFAREADSRAEEEGGRRDGEAVVEQTEGADGAVRLMTIHQAKGLEFPVTVLVDLGRGNNSNSDLLSVNSDASEMLFRWRPRIGANRIPTFASHDFVEREKESAVAEEIRIVYVGFTRAEGRLLLSGSFNRPSDPKKPPTGAGRGDTNLDRMLKAELLGGLADFCADEDAPASWTEQLPNGSSIKVTVSDSSALDLLADLAPPPTGAAGPPNLHRVEAALDPAPVAFRPSSVSYSGLQTAGRCAFRWYTENVLGLSDSIEVNGAAEESAAKRLKPVERGAILHGILERTPLDGSCPTISDVTAEADAQGVELAAADADEVLELVAAITSSPTWQRLVSNHAEGRRVAREEGFAVLLPVEGQVIPLHGIFDVVADNGDGSLLVVDWKTSSSAADEDDLVGRVERDYSIQRDAYGFAALSGSLGQTTHDRVEVVHLYAERPDEPQAASFTSADLKRLEVDLGLLARPLLEGDVPVAEKPWEGLCNGCPARGRLCSWAPEQTTGTTPPA
ncbi:MAG: UvrD-helicase domain-containing protein [Solirubrobacterales bacterium]|nr:UvrD-helicase domain-containing protein [Solirubrobacterales bacterium]